MGNYYKYYDKKFLGVCYKIGKCFNIDPTFIRVLFIIFSYLSIFKTFIGYLVIGYLVDLFFRKKTDLEEQNKPIKRLYKDNHNKKISGVCSGLGIYLGIDFSIIRVLFIIALIFNIVFTGIAYLIMSSIMEFDNDIID